MSDSIMGSGSQERRAIMDDFVSLYTHFAKIIAKNLNSVCKQRWFQFHF